MSASLAPTAVQAYLHEHIPLSAAMGVTVRDCTLAGVTLAAPLGPNINHRGTIFGGSASAVAILAAWTWLHFALRSADLHARLVIQRNTVDYLAPIATDFEAKGAPLPPADFEKFLATLRRHARARATLTADLWCEGTKVASFTGDYVAVKLDKEYFFTGENGEKTGEGYPNPKRKDAKLREDSRRREGNFRAKD